MIITEIGCWIRWAWWKAASAAEAHPGLGSWVSAIGTVAAIFATWGLSRHEYNRTNADAAATERSNLATYHEIVEEFVANVKPYVDYARAHKSPLQGWYTQHMNEPEQTRFRDLGEIPIPQWRSKAAYFALRNYQTTLYPILYKSSDIPLPAISDQELDALDKKATALLGALKPGK